MFTLFSALYGMISFLSIMVYTSKLHIHRIETRIELFITAFIVWLIIAIIVAYKEDRLHKKKIECLDRMRKEGIDKRNSYYYNGRFFIIKNPYWECD